MPRFIAVHPVAFKDEDMIALFACCEEPPSTFDPAAQLSKAA